MGFAKGGTSPALSPPTALSRMTTPPEALADPSTRPHPGPARPLKVAVLGATGLVGTRMLRLVEERALPVSEMIPLASARSTSRRVSFAGEEIGVRPVSRESLRGVDLLLASAGGDVSREWLPLAAREGTVCIDNTSAFRMDRGVPLVVPEVNSDELSSIEFGKGGAIIANPNCSTIQLAVVLEPLRHAFGLERVQVSTYQSISGAGRGAVERFESATAARLRDCGDGPSAASAGSDPGVPAFDVFPRIGELDDNGHTSEELKMMREVPKILGEEVPLDVTCVRVPVFTGHAESVVVQTREPVDVRAAMAVLSEAPGVRVHAVDPPTPAATAGTHEVHVGRMRASSAFTRGLQLWVVADNLLKGAAWNAVQIAESLLDRGSVR